MNINKSNYSYHKKLFNLLINFQFGLMNLTIDVQFHPSNVLESFEKKSLTLAIKGLKMGLGDCLTMGSHLSKEQKNDLNKTLKENDFPTLEVLAFKIRNTFKRVIKRGRIKNKEEYYIIIEILSDMEYEISIEERLKLNELVSDFESKIK
jgi:hypothetical protein